MTTIMTSCDPIYLREHAPALMVSAVVSGHNFHLHVVDAPPKDLLFMERLREQCIVIGHRAGFDPQITLTSFGFHQTFLADVIQTPERMRTLWACDRFFTAERMLGWHTPDGGPTFESLVIVDTDCTVLRHFDEPPEDVGLFLREPLKTNAWEESGTRVAAGLVYVKNSACGRGFLRSVIEGINRGQVQWFLDQVALADAASYLLPSTLHAFSSEVLDWEFRDRSVIWTGKGPRKYTNGAYLAKKASFNEMLNHANL